MEIISHFFSSKFVGTYIKSKKTKNATICHYSHYAAVLLQTFILMIKKSLVSGRIRKITLKKNSGPAPAPNIYYCDLEYAILGPKLHVIMLF